jgi:hypothetical protein
MQGQSPVMIDDKIETLYTQIQGNLHMILEIERWVRSAQIDPTKKDVAMNELESIAGNLDRSIISLMKVSEHIP